MIEGAAQLAVQLGAKPPMALRGTKHILLQQRGRTVQDGLSYVAAYNAATLKSKELEGAVSAFLSKRAKL